MNLEIKEIDYGLGFTVNDGSKKWIEINKYLREYPNLYNHVISHEMQHFNSPNKSIDFWIDFKDLFNFRKGWDIFLFSIKHPRALLSNSPIFYENRRWSVNWFMVIINLTIISIILGGLLII